MKVGSLFSGGGGGDLGLHLAGHEIVFGCEIEPKARAVLRHHNPTTPIYHDVKDITYDRLVADGIAIPELISGGSPCQDLSVAGRRGGLDGARSGLFWEQCRIADECSADWVLWENVPGAFSSNKGADFAEVLYGLTGHRPEVPRNGWKTAGICVGPKRSAVWRVLNAQAFGVPQRRRRVFVVAGPRALGRKIAGVLFEPESSNRDTSPRRQTEPHTPTTTQTRFGTSSVGAATDIAQCLTTKTGSRLDPNTESFILEPVTSQVQLKWAGSVVQENIAAPLLSGTRTTDIDGGTWAVGQ